jgi:hypothetical protein
MSWSALDYGVEVLLPALSLMCWSSIVRKQGPAGIAGQLSLQRACASRMSRFAIEAPAGARFNSMDWRWSALASMMAET